MQDVDRFFAVSEYYVPVMARLLGIRPDQIPVVPLGIRLDGYERRQTRDEVFRVGYFARIAPEKGLHVLAEAYPLFRKRTGGAPVRLEAAGHLSRANEPYLAGVRRSLDEAGLGNEFVYHGARDFDEPGVIVTFEVSSEKLVRDAAQFGWDLRALQEQGRLKIISTTRRVFQQEVQEPDSLLLTDANRMGARRIFVDGLAGVARNGNGDARELFHILVEALHRERVTAMFALDAPADRAAVGAMPEDFIADTIIRLGREPVRGAVVRSLEVVKSRGQEYLLGVHSFRIVNGRGGEVYRRAQAAPEEPTDQRTPTNVTARVATGTEGLDELLSGGYFEGSTTLVAGISGVGKTVMALQFLAEGARRGQVGLMVTLDEPQDRMIRNATTVGIDLQREIDRGTVDI